MLAQLFLAAGVPLILLKAAWCLRSHYFFLFPRLTGLAFAASFAFSAARSRCAATRIAVIQSLETVSFSSSSFTRAHAALCLPVTFSSAIRRLLSVQDVSAHISESFRFSS